MLIHNLNFAFENNYTGNTQQIINNLNLEIKPKQIYALIGPNGVGKSTVLNAIWKHSYLSGNLSKVKMGIQKAILSQDLPEKLDININDKTLDYYQIVWQIYQAQIDLEQTHNIRNPFVLDYQELYDWFIQTTDYIPKNHFSDFQKRLNDLGITPENISSDYNLCSPGTRKKILLAQLFSTNPEYLLLDELTNHLDYKAIEVLTAWIKDYNGAVLLVDHNIDFLMKIVKNWIYIPSNENRTPIIFKDINYTDLMEELDNRRKNQEATVKNLENKKKLLEKSLRMQKDRVEIYGVNIGAAARNLEKRIQREITDNPINDEIDKLEPPTFGRNKNSPKVKKNNLIKIRNLEFWIGELETQNIAEFDLYLGEKVRINGLNGRGKSSLLKFIKAKLLSQNLQNDSQFIGGEFLLSPTLEKDNYFVFEQITNYGKGLTIAGYILQNLKWQEYKIVGFLKKLNLNKFNENQPLESLSLGELVRLQFGILAEKIATLQLIILDEPGNFLDIFTQQALIKLLDSYKGSLLVVTHDQFLVDKLDLDREFNLI